MHILASTGIILFMKLLKHLMTVKHVSRKSVSELQRNSLPASFFFFFFYCGWNKVGVMQCHDGKETKGTFRENAIPITWRTHTNYLVSVSSAQKTSRVSKYKKIYI